MVRACVFALSVLVLAGTASAQGTGSIWLADGADGDGEVVVRLGSTATIEVWMTYEAGDIPSRMYGMDAGLKHNKFGSAWNAEDGNAFQVVGFNPEGVPGPHGDAIFPLYFGNHGPLDQDGDQVPDKPPFAGNLNDYFLGWGSEFPPTWDATGLDAGDDTSWLLDVIVIEGVSVTGQADPDEVNFIRKNHLIAPSYIDVYYSGGWILDEVKFTQVKGAYDDRVQVYVLPGRGPAPEPGALVMLFVGGFLAFRR